MKKERQIKPHVITNTLNALTELNNLLHSNTYNLKRCKEILKAHKVHLALMTSAVRVGIFKRIAFGQYKSNVVTIDPIHARHCVQMFYDSQKQYDAKHREKKRSLKVGKTLPTKSIAPVQVQPVVEVPVKRIVESPTPPSVSRKTISKPQPIKSRRSVSVFWGLLNVSF